MFIRYSLKYSFIRHYLFSEIFTKLFLQHISYPELPEFYPTHTVTTSVPSSLLQIVNKLLTPAANSNNMKQV